MNICVIVSGGYDCSWQLVATSYSSVDAFCPDSPVINTITLGCIDFERKKSIITKSRIGEVGYDGMNILWHELKHIRLYENCMQQDFITHFKCATFADWHGDFNVNPKD